MEVKQGSEMREFDRLFRKIDQCYHNISVRMGLSDTTGQILYAMIELGDGCLQTEIAKWYSCSKQTVSSAVKVMERKGLLWLEPGKGRDMHLHLTNSGQELVERTIYPMIDMENSVFSAMTPEESREFLRMIRQYVGIFEEKSSELIQRIQNETEKEAST